MNSKHYYYVESATQDGEGDIVVHVETEDFSVAREVYEFLRDCLPMFVYRDSESVRILEFGEVVEGVGMSLFQRKYNKGEL